MQALMAKQIFTGDVLLEQHAILLDAGKIIDVVSVANIPPHTEKIDYTDCLLAPGFIDIQINGGGGVLFNETPNIETLKTISHTHARLGTTSFLPTLISTDDKTMQAASLAVRQAMQENVPGILGIHYEGPWLNAEKNGIHAKNNICYPNTASLQQLEKLSVAKTLVTIAPEIFSDQQIQQLIAHGFIIFVGHSNATYARMQQTFAAGVTGVTHLFNACSSLMSREPGIVGAALLSDQTWCSVIVDGHHVSYPSLQIALNCKNRKKFILISDAMTVVGTDSQSFNLDNEIIAVTTGKCTNAVGTLAGSVLDIATALRNTVNNLNITLVEALRMSSTNAAEMLGLEQQIGRIIPEAQADLVALNAQLHVRAVIQQGQLIDLSIS